VNRTTCGNPSTHPPVVRSFFTPVASEDERSSMVLGPMPRRALARTMYQSRHMDISRRVVAVTRAFIFIATVSGCAVGPDFHPVPAPAVSGYTPEPLPPRTASADVIGGAPQTLRSGGNISGQWWTLFHSSQLNRLIEQALKANPNLQAAQAALR
jgi:hypothetical protein